ncbi:MAG: transposase [Clostridiales bacterium]|nr:transposase [Clostridiales bacterium]
MELDAAGIDMREPYKSATNSAIPNADVCIDPVHVKFVSRALNELENQ